MAEPLRSALLRKLASLLEHLESAGFDVVVGGGIALAFHSEPRFTNDIDLNVAATPTTLDALIDSLPPEVVVTDANITDLRRTDQTRLRWPDPGQQTDLGTPIDVFLPAHPTFHHAAHARAEPVTLGGLELRILCATDLAIFKALFDRAKDWVDIEAMLRAGKVDVQDALAWLGALVGEDDSRIPRLTQLATAPDDVEAPRTPWKDMGGRNGP